MYHRALEHDSQNFDSEITTWNLIITTKSTISDYRKASNDTLCKKKRKKNLPQKVRLFLNQNLYSRHYLDTAIHSRIVIAPPAITMLIIT